MSSTAAIRVVCWTARCWSLASLAFVAAFVFGTSEPASRSPTVTEWIGLACFPCGVLVGLLVGCRWEAWGGGIAVASLAGFYIWHFVTSGRLAAGPWFVVLAGPGLLFLTTAAAAHLANRRCNGSSANGPELAPTCRTEVK